MSVKIMGQVWDCELPATEKYILLALADHADHDGYNIYPSVGRVAWKTGYDERTVQRTIKQLISKGILIPDGQGKKGTNQYRIEFTCLPQREDYYPRHRVTPAQSHPGTESPNDVSDVTPTPGTESPEPSYNHQIEPPLQTGGSDLDSDYAKVCKVYENEISLISPYTADLIKDWLELYPVDWAIEAIKIAVKANNRRATYIGGILRKWKVEGKSNGSKNGDEPNVVYRNGRKVTIIK